MVMRGCRHIAPPPPYQDSRVPITGFKRAFSNRQQRTLLQAIFLLAFNTFIRLGELVVKSKGLASMMIQHRDIIFLLNLSIQIHLTQSHLS